MTVDEVTETTEPVIPVTPVKLVKPRNLYTKKELENMYYKNRELCGHMFIYGEVNDKMLDKVMSVLDEYLEVPEIRCLVVHINSSGGKMPIGYSIYNLLKMFRKPVISVVESWCMSAATVIYFAGDLLIWKPNVMFLIHQHATELPMNKFKYLRRKVYNQQLIHDASEEFYIDHTTMSKRQAKDYLRSDKYITESFALKHNICDQVFDRKKIKQLKLNGSPRKILLSDFMPDKFEQNIKQMYDNKVLTEMNISKFMIIDLSDYYFYWYSVFLSNILAEIPIPVEMFSIGSALFNNTVIIGNTLDKFYIHKYLVVTLYSMSDDTKKEVGTKDTIESSLQRMKFVEDAITDFYDKKTKLPKNIIKTLNEKLYTLTSKAALEYGLADGLISDKLLAQIYAD